MWPPAALEFLRELEDNNDRDWFRANRHRYDADLLGPARELAEKLSEFGEPRFFRPYNNTRFRPGPPLKEQLAVSIGNGGAVFYFQLSLDGLLTGAGMHHPAAEPISSSASVPQSTSPAALRRSSARSRPLRRAASP